MLSMNPDVVVVAIAKDGQEAVNLAREHHPDLVIMDYNMPKKDGREALKEIKADATLREIPIVVLTTSKDEEDILRSYNLGANSYITKPVTFEGLVEVIKSLGKYWFEIVELPIDAKHESSGK